MRTITFANIGLTEDDIHLEYTKLPDGGSEVSAHLSERGHALLEVAAREHGMTSDDFFELVLRSSLHMRDIAH